MIKVKKIYDIITIGSATVDVLIKVDGELNKHEDHLDLCYHLGDKLLVSDLFFSTGGGATNTAVAFSRLGLKTAFLGIVGTDDNGELILKDLEKENVHFIGKVKSGKSGYSVILPGRSDRTILSYKGVNNNLELKDVYPSALKSDWLYISTMLGESLLTMKSLIYWAKKQDAKVALNLSEYLAIKGISKLKSILENVDILIINKQEATALTKRKEIKDMLISISKYVPTIVITDSSSPIHAYQNGVMYKKKIVSINPVDKTGAGDAFASGFIYGRIKNKDLETCLDYGHRQALSVMKHLGAKNNLLKEL